MTDKNNIFLNIFYKPIIIQIHLIHLSSKLSPSSSPRSSFRTSYVFLNTNSWNNRAKMAPPNGIPVYSQIQVHPFTDKISAPNPMAGFRTAPDAVM